MTTACPSIPGPTRGELAGFGLLLAWLAVGYAAALRLAAGVSWATASWQATACVLTGAILLLLVIEAVSVSRRIAGVSPAAYRAVAPIMGASQYALPWLGWSVLIWWMNGGRLSTVEALESGAAISAFSYLSGFVIVLTLRPRAGDVEVTRTDAILDALPAAFDGYRILHISDIHGGSRLSLASVSERLAPAENLQSDLIVFTGDLAARGDAVEPTADSLARLAARDGIVAVLGNHDHWMGKRRVATALQSRGLVILGNDSLRLERGGQTLYLVGVESVSYVGRDDLQAALRGVPEGAPVVMLTHSPDIVYKELSSRAALILSGHTHGGQMVFPWIGPLYVPTGLGRERMSGLLEAEGRLLYISRGLGEVFPPMRLNCSPELALITLRRR